MTQTAKEIYDSFVTELKEAREFRDKIDAKNNMAKILQENPEIKDELYNKTLDWVNNIRTNRMKNQEPIDSLMPGRELEPNECTIAKSLDTNYITSIAGDVLVEILGITVKSNKLEEWEWVAEWVNVNDDDDYGWEILPWYAFMVAVGFDHGAFPELVQGIPKVVA